LERPTGKLLLESVDGDGNHPYRFEVFNADGRSIVEAETIVGERYGPWEAEIEVLYEAARRNALGVDSVLRGLEDDLGINEVEDPAENDIPF
jgi:hypothetical protein